MAYTTTRYSAQFALRLIDNIQAYLEASTATALAEIDGTLANFVDYRTLKEQGVDRPPERHLGPARVRRMGPDGRAAVVGERGGIAARPRAIGLN